jgi:predicted NBD/HSP70 family sugar kinase
VHIANDGKCAALAELKSGALKGCRNASVYIIGTGVGGGLIIGGEVLNGSHFTAGEYSFLRLSNADWDDPGTTAGMLCSTTGLMDLNRRMTGFSTQPLLNGRQFFDKVNAGDPLSMKVLDKFCRQVAMHIANLTILLDLEKVAIGGGISRQPILTETIRKCLDELYSNPGLYFDPVLPKAEVVPCRFGSEANQVGAYYYYRNDV